MLSLRDSVQNLKLLSPKAAKALEKLGIKTLIDLLYHLPRDWQDLSEIKTVRQALPGERINLKVKLKSLHETRSKWRRLHVFEAIFEDATGSIVSVWFNQPFLRYNLKVGREYFASGKVYLKDQLQLQNPIIELVKPDVIHTAGIVPVYELTSGLTQKQMRYWLNQIIPSAVQLPDMLPSEIKKTLDLPDLSAALRQIHFPHSHKELKAAYSRLAFEELFLFQLALLSFKSKLKSLPAPQIPFDSELVRKFVRGLPFKLTNSQRLAIWEILKDLKESHPMNRLLEGEVGSGKTVVAGIAMLAAAEKDYQSVMLAPTEILAWQHYETLKELFKNKNVEIALLTRSHKISTSLQLSPPARLRVDEVQAGGSPGERVSSNFPSPSDGEGSRERLLNAISSGQIKIIVGTHALLQENVKFHKIGLLVIDEQHRFGVRQRAALVDRGQSRTETRTNADENPHRSVFIPHLLSMTATPIPRTLALAFYGDLDISELRELPLGRKKIITRLVPPEKREVAYEFIRKELKKGRQMYVVTPLIDASTPSSSPPSHGGENPFSSFSPSRKEGGGWEGVRAATSEVEKLKQIFPEFQIGLLHGRLPGEEKKEIMEAFKRGGLQILVSTSVIEVGVDVANASVMVIENAERFGLSQLHQLRGRVGRGQHQSYCLLFAENLSEYTQERLMAVVNSSDGFELAEKDLELRGSGEIIGTRQSGFIPFKIAKLSDKKLISLAKKEAQELLKKDPDLGNYPLLKQKVEQISKEAHLE